MNSLVAQWQGNRRLRYASGVALLFFVFHGAAALSDARGRLVAEYRGGQALLLRLQGAAADASWQMRADEAGAAWKALENSLPVAVSAGEAQAELQAQLQEIAAQAGVIEPRVRAEAALTLETLPEFRVVLARLDGSLASEAIGRLLAALAERPWLSVERIELHDGNPARMQLVVRGHFRSPSGDAL